MAHHRGTEDTEGSSPSCTHDIVGAAIEVHRQLGPGLLESAYQTCLCRELLIRGIGFRQQVPLPIQYRGLDLDCGYRLDLVVADSVIVEVKAVSRVLPIHRAQVLTYLKLTNYRLGLLLNFNVEVLRSGLYRIING
jgi:GxxExxY protein